MSSAQADISFTPTRLLQGFGAPWAGYSFPATHNDLTALGEFDWAYYGVSGGSILELNSKSGGTGLGLPTFSNPNRDGNLQNGTGGYVGTHFAYTDGASPVSDADVTAAGATGMRGGSITYNNDPGPSFTVSAPVGEETKTLYVWLSAFKASGANAFNISLWDGATQIGSPVYFSGAPQGDTPSAYIYAIQYGGGTTVSGNLDFKFHMTGGNQDTTTFTLNAVALGSMVSSPVFNPATGIYPLAQSVAISTPTSGASIYYTTDGGTPTESSTLYSGPVNVNSSMTLNAIAFKSGVTPSPLASASYVIGDPPVVEIPVFSPVAGTHALPQSVVITTATSGASIRYTTNGSEPTSTNGTLYSTPVSVPVTTTLKAIAFKFLMGDSAVASAEYVITIAADPIPGKIEAEAYFAMSGIQKENTGDTGSGQNVGFVDTNDWMDYKVNVQTPGTYNVEFRIAREPSGSGELQIKSDANLLATVALPSTGGWQTWQTVTATGVTLAAGNQTLRVHVSNGGWNLNWMNFIQNTSSGYSAWSTTQFGASSNDPLVAGDHADPNSNGIANLMEYALGGDPTGNSTGQAILPESGTSVGNRMTLTFQRGPSLTDINYMVEVSENLTGSWTQLASSTAGSATVNLAAFSVTETGSTLKTVVVEDTSVINSTSKRFIRLRVVRP